VTPENAWVYAILPFLTMTALLVGFVIVFRQRAKTRRALGAGRAPRAPRRPWWERPWVWLATFALAVTLAVTVWPWFAALAVVAIALGWRTRPRRTPTVDPRSNGHAHHDGGTFTSE
jgi:hypothetical protein